MSCGTSCSSRSTCERALVAGQLGTGAIAVVRALFGWFLEHPDDLPPEYHRMPGDLPTRVADFIAGMTDRYALRTYEQLFLPREWLLD